MLGCVAWLTNKRILKALQLVESSIIIQKENFLRPNNYKSDNFTKQLKKLYHNLKPIEYLDYCDWSFDNLTTQEDCYPPKSKCNIETLINHIGGNTDEIEAISCVGNLNTEKTPAFPRMHHKFMIF